MSSFNALTIYWVSRNYPESKILETKTGKLEENLMSTPMIPILFKILIICRLIFFMKIIR